MAITTETIRKITIEGSARGVDQATASLIALAAAQGRVSVETDVQAKKVLSAAQEWQKQNLSVVAGAREQANYEKAVRTAKSALDQGIITHADYAARVDLLKDKFGQAGLAQRAFGAATSGVSGQLIALSAGAGPAGVFLAALGPWGVAASVGLGALGKAFSFVSDESTRMGEKAIELRGFVEATGLTVGQISSLKHAAAEFGIAGDSMQSAFQQLTFKLDAAHKAGGQLYDDLRQVSPQLGEQIRLARTDADAIDVLAKAYRGTTDQAQRAAIARAAFGRQGLGIAPVLGAVADAGGLANMAQKSHELSAAIEGNINTWAKLQAQIDETKKRSANILASIFTTEGLQIQLYAAQQMERLAKAAKEYADNTQKFPRSVALYPGAILSSPESQAADARLRLRQGLSGGKGFGADQSEIDSWHKLTDSLIIATSAAGIATKTTKELQDSAEGDAKLEKERIGLLGSAATIDEHRVSRLKDLQSALLNNKIVQEDYNRAVASANIDARVQKDALRIGQLGELASVTEINKQKEDALQKTIRDGATFSATELANIRARNALLTESSKIENQMVFDRQQLFKSQIDQSIDQTLRAAGIPPASARADAIRDYMRMTDALKQVKETGTEFAQSFVSGLTQGKSVLDSLVSSLDALATKMASKAVTDFVNGLATGDFTAAALDAVVAVGAFVASAMGKESAALKKAKADWQGMQAAALDFANTIGGAVQGELTKSIKANLAQGQQFFDAAVKAKDFAAAMAIRADLFKMVDRENAAFRSTFAATVAALTSGQGQSGAAMTAVQNVKAVADSIKGFITDTTTAGADVGKATEAGKQFLLTLITGAVQLSDVGNKLATINASAAALQGTLIDLGDSASKAAAEIASGVTLAIANLHQSFTTDLQRQLNSATGNDFVNSLLDLMTQTAQQRNDAAQFGNVDTSLIDVLFTAQAQKIVDGAGLMGSAFDDLIRQFPSLTGVIHESTAALKAQQDAQNAAAKSIVDYVNGLTAGSASTLPPAARLTAAQGAYNSKLALAQGGNTDALSSITGDADNLKNALQAMFGSSSQFQQGLAAIKSQLLALPAVTQATDPVTAALRDVLLAVQQGNASQLVASQLAGSGLATQTTAAAISASAAQTSSLQTSANIILSSSTQLQTTTNTLLNSIEALQGTASAQLALLNDQLSAHPLSASLRFNNTTQTVTVSNNMIDALNKIVINTRAIANNTASLVFLQPGGAGFPQYYGTLATGGVIPPGGLALVSEHSAGGGRFLRAGPEPIGVFPGAPQGANDNREMIAEIRALRQEVAELRRLSATHIRVDEQGHAETAKTVDASAKKNQPRLISGQGRVA